MGILATEVLQEQHDALKARVAELETERDTAVAEATKHRTSVLNAKGIIAKLEEERDAAREEVRHKVVYLEEARAANLELTRENQTLAENVVHQENVKLKKQLAGALMGMNEYRDMHGNAERRIEKLTKKQAKQKKRLREERDIAHEAALAYVAEIKRLKDTLGELMAQADEVNGTQPIPIQQADDG